MTDMMALARQARALGQVCAYVPRHGEAAPAARGLTVALARQPGTPAAEVARAVGARLGWPVHDRDLLERLARELGLPVSVLEALDERPQSWLLECLQGLATPAAVSEGRYVSHLARLIRELAAAGRCVIVGRGAAQLLPARSTLRVYLVGHPEDRVDAFRRSGLTRHEASRRVRELERGWTQFVTKHFQKDPRPAEGYDLLLNTSQWPVARCADFIVDAAQTRAAEGASRP